MEYVLLYANRITYFLLNIHYLYDYYYLCNMYFLLYSKTKLNHNMLFYENKQIFKLVRKQLFNNNIKLNLL